MSAFGFYKKVVALNSHVHRNLKLTFNEVNFSFAQHTNVVLLAGVEFAEAAREYPIVFLLDENGKMKPVVLLGVRNGENLFVNDQGQWDARYIPAFVRRYPFIMVNDGANDQLMVCIDESCPALNADNGELLINAEGNLEPRMNEVMQFLQNFQQEFERTELITSQLYDLGLFVKQGARFDTISGDTFQLNDFYMIDETKFRQIAEDKLPELFRSGALGLVYLHLASLGNLRGLLDRVSTRSGSQNTVMPPQHSKVH